MNQPNPFEAGPIVEYDNYLFLAQRWRKYLWEEKTTYFKYLCETFIRQTLGWTALESCMFTLLILDFWTILSSPKN
jgi:hypothetical protein